MLILDLYLAKKNVKVFCNISYLTQYRQGNIFQLIDVSGGVWTLASKSSDQPKVKKIWNLYKKDFSKTFLSWKIKEKNFVNKLDSLRTTDTQSCLI